MEIWSVTYVNDEVADDFGTKLFRTEAEAEAFATGYERGGGNDSDSVELFTVIEKHIV